MANELVTKAMMARHDKLKQGRGYMGLDPTNSDAERKARLRPDELGHKHTQRLDGFYGKLIVAYGKIFKRESLEETTPEGRQ